MATKKIKKTDELLGLSVSYPIAERFGLFSGSLISLAVVTVKQVVLPHLTGYPKWVLSLVVLGGLVYSALTVYDFFCQTTKNRAKAASMVTLLDGLAVFIPLGYCWEAGVVAFAVGLFFVAGATVCLAAINGFTMAQNCISKFVDRPERLAVAAFKKRQRQAILDAKKLKAERKHTKRLEKLRVVTA